MTGSTSGMDKPRNNSGSIARLRAFEIKILSATKQSGQEHIQCVSFGRETGWTGIQVFLCGGWWSVPGIHILFVLYIHKHIFAAWLSGVVWTVVKWTLATHAGLHICAFYSYIIQPLIFACRCHRHWVGSRRSTAEKGFLLDLQFMLSG
jgi:hypothetical protein